MRSTKKSKVIGEGKYGCVHKPSLKCKKTTKNITYKNKISKLMETSEADIELKKYHYLEDIDKDEKLYLGKPIKCSPKKSKLTEEAIDQCDYFKPEKMDNYSLLIMKYGGSHLKEFADKISEYHISDPSEITTTHLKKVMCNFWVEARRLFLGLVIFHNNNIIHHDLKPQNIVYDITKNRLNYIDFGMMISVSQVKQMCMKSKYYNAIFHWSFPPEIKFLNKNKFSSVYKKTQNKQDEFDIFLKDVNDFDDGKINYFMETTIVDFNKNTESPIMKKNVNDFYTMLFEDMDKHSYSTFLNKTWNTIDIYGLGIALIYVLNNTRSLIDENVSQELHSLFMDMLHLNVFRRIEPLEAQQKFENITKKLISSTS
jgi:serine/threonine protein kinase